MRMVWVNDDGDRFNSYEEAYDDAREKMTFFDFADYFRNYISYEELLKWAMKQDEFWPHYDEIVDHSQIDYFEEWYHEEEVEDEEDDD